jgi:GGDEF domain-containing protein
MQSMLEEFQSHEVIKEYGVSFSYGIASSDGHKDMNDILNEADRLMYQQKVMKKTTV